MSKGFIVTSIGLSGLVLLLSATSLLGHAPSLHTSVGRAAVTARLNVQSPGKAESTGTADGKQSSAVAEPNTGVSKEFLALLASLIRLEPASGFLIGALLLGIATSLRLKVICKSEPEPELRA
jgi:hypothetical protein